VTLITIEDSKPNKKKEATDRAIETERSMGGDPLVEVVPGIGDVVIDRNNQDSVREAVAQHGGWDSAIKDSINNQNNYYESLENKSTSPEYNSESSSFTDSSSIENIKNESVTENFPDPNKDLVRNSNESVVVLNKISQQLDNITKSINKSFNSLGSSIKDIKSEQKNYFYNSTNNSSTNSSNLNTSKGGGEPNNILEIRGDVPLKEDFPNNFKMESLFSNLRS